MKNVLFFASYVLALFMFCSCTNEEVLTDTGNTIESKYKTLSELESYNELILGKTLTRNSNENSGAKVTTDDITDAINVVEADFAGAATGIRIGKAASILAGAATGGTGAAVTSSLFAAIFGASASYKTIKQNKTAKGNPNVQKKNPDPRKNNVAINPTSMDSTFWEVSEKVYMDNIGACEQQYIYNAVSDKIQIPERFQYLIRIGEEHNALVSTVLEVEKKDSCDLSLENFKGVIPSINNITSEQLDTLLSNYQIKKAYAKLLHDVSVCTDATGFDINKFLNLNSNIPDYVKQALKSYSDLLSSYPTNLDDIVEITNGYINIIETNNEFNDNDREMIYSALIVSLYSPQLWGVFDKQ